MLLMRISTCNRGLCSALLPLHLTAKIIMSSRSICSRIISSGFAFSATHNPSKPLVATDWSFSRCFLHRRSVSSLNGPPSESKKDVGPLSPSGVTFLSARSIVDKSPKALQPYLRLIRADKPAGTWLLYWPCAWSIALAADPGSLPDIKLLTLFGIGAFLMRGAGCVINDMWDKDFDKKVARTRERPLASGEVQFVPALVWLAGQLGVSLAILSQFNWFSIVLGTSSLSIVVAYPLFKRFTSYPQLALGLAFNWGALLGYAAVRGYIDVYSVLPLYAAGICWTMVYDTIYAHQDKADDALIGIGSTALKFGDRTPLMLWEFSAAMLFSLGMSGYMAGLSWPYFLGLVGVAGHLTYQSFSLNVDDPADCWEKFKSNHYLGALIFFSIVAGNLLRSDETVSERREFRDAVIQNLPWQTAEKR